jgi:predicted exporter
LNNKTKAKLATGLALDPEQQLRAGDSMTAALRALAGEALHEAHKSAIQFELTDGSNRAETEACLREQAAHEALVRDVTDAICRYVVTATPPLQSLAARARMTPFEPKWIRGLADRLATKLFLRASDVDDAWALHGLPTGRAS